MSQVKRGFQKGHHYSKGYGRPKGAKGKFTNLRDAFIGAFKDIGGQQALVDWVNEKVTFKNRKGKIISIFFSDRKKEFFKMITTMLPKDVQITGADGTPLFPYREFKDEELDGLLDRLAERSAKRS